MEAHLKAWGRDRFQTQGFYAHMNPNPGAQAPEAVWMTAALPLRWSGHMARPSEMNDLEWRQRGKEASISQEM